MNTSLGQATSTGAASAVSPRLTSDDYDKIQDYVAYASSLPVVVQAVEVFVGYKAAGVAGLEPAELRDLFEEIRGNADEWDPVREMINQQTATLVSISGRVVRSGEALINAIQALPFYVKIRATIGQDLSELPAIDVPDERFEPADTQKKSQLAGQLESLLRVNREQIDGTEETMRLLERFRRGIQNLEPVVAAKRQLVKNSNLEKIGNEVTVEPMIAALQREYERAVQTDGRNASIIEAKRKELDAAIQTLKSQLDVYQGRQRVTYTMGRLFAHFTELGLVMVDAEMALGHLWLAWREAVSALDNASRTFESIDSSRKLVTFLGEFKTVINNWRLVQNRATELNRIF